MFKNSKVIPVLSILILMLWGSILLYFYASGRLQNYLPPDGIFRPLILVSGIGLLILAFFNLFTLGVDAGAGCCDHDHHGHDHGEDGCCDHDSHQGCSHDTVAKTACCGEEHHHHHHEHSHGKSECCGGHETHQHGASCSHHHEHSHGKSGCCGGHGTHQHGASCSHHHKEENDSHHRAVCDHEGGHAHGVLEESGLVGKLVALTLLCVPMTYAAIMTPDRYSPNAVVNKGLYNPNYNSRVRADEFSLKKKTEAKPETATKVAASTAPPVQETPPAPNASATPPVTAESTAPSNMAAEGADEAKSYGNFTLKDLEAQVPRSPEGYFQLEVPEIYYTASDKEVQSVLAGQSVETIAQVLPEKVNNDAGKRVRIFKLSVQCCAADARPYSIPVEFATTAPAIQEMGWVKIKGKVEYATENDQIIPMIRAESMEEAAQPADQVIY